MSIFSKKGYVYLGVDQSSDKLIASKLIKIGKANDVAKREAQIQKMNPSFHVVLAFLVEDPYKTEQSIHKGFAEHRVDGEWFLLRPEHVELLCRVLGRTMTIEQIKTEFNYQ